MSWGKIDDQFHAHRKAKRAWKGHPRALGLHLMAISYCAGHLTDGLVDYEFVEEKLPAARDRNGATAALVTAGLWAEEDDGWRINDWLEYNPSRADVLEKRRSDAERKARARRGESEESPQGVRADSGPTPDGVRDPSRAGARAPVPAVPGLSHPIQSPEGERARPPADHEFKLEQIPLPGGDLARLDGSAYVQRRIDGAIGGWLRDQTLDAFHADDGIPLVKAMLAHRIKVTRANVLEVDSLALAVAESNSAATPEWIIDKACKRYVLVRSRQADVADAA